MFIDTSSSRAATITGARPRRAGCGQTDPQNLRDVAALSSNAGVVVPPSRLGRSLGREPLDDTRRSFSSTRRCTIRSRHQCDARPSPAARGDGHVRPVDELHVARDLSVSSSIRWAWFVQTCRICGVSLMAEANQKQRSPSPRASLASDPVPSEAVQSQVTFFGEHISPRMPQLQEVDGVSQSRQQVSRGPPSITRSVSV